MKEGILLLNKPAGKTSFYLVSLLRRLTKIKKIGHAGTLDPFATGVMVMLIGKNYTRLQPTFLNSDKEYTATLKLGIETDTGDLEGATTNTSEKIPTNEEILALLPEFQGELLQTPPMYSAKKVGGKKLYELARKGVTIEREPKKIQVTTTFLSYDYPHLKLHFACSKGTYIRQLAVDIGKKLGSYAHLVQLERVKSGSFLLENCLSIEEIQKPGFQYQSHLHTCKSPEISLHYKEVAIQ
ncbi:MAG: tRNA pseudouridine(55) synthase TruB [Candidatus Algichlamydia australiensis]|nr:tRNA pseudouridine(55) synthase TruB [Chlamydiales bacterium]